MPAYPQPPYQSTLASSRCHAHGLRRAARGRMAVVLPNLLSQGGPATILKQNARFASSRKTIKKKNTIEASSCQHKWQNGSTLKRRPRQGTNWGVPQQTNQGPSEFSKCRWGSGRVGGGLICNFLQDTRASRWHPRPTVRSVARTQARGRSLQTVLLRSPRTVRAADQGAAAANHCKLR